MSLLIDASPALLAYLDPGSGSLAFQILIAGLMSGMFFIRSLSSSARLALHRLQRRG